MAGFCGNSTFWNSSSFSKTNPHFTPCFLVTVPYWLPVLWLLVTAAFRLYNGRNKQHHVIFQYQTTAVRVIKIGLCIILMVLTGVYLWSSYYYGYRCDVTSGIPDALVVGLVLNILSYLYVVVITHLDRRKGTKRTWDLWIYWLLSVVCSLVIVQNDIVLQARCINSIINYGICACIVCQFILYGVSEGKPPPGDYQSIDEVNRCPIEDASILSLLTFSWFTPLVARCYKDVISTSDIWDQYSSLKANAIIQDIDQQWTAEKERSVRNLNHLLKKKNYNIKHCSGNERTHLVEEQSSEQHTKQSLHRVFIRTYGLEWLVIALVGLTADLITLVIPLILSEIISLVQEPQYDEGDWYPIFLAISFFIATQLMVFLNQHSEQLMLQLSVKVKTALIGLIFKKCLKCSSTSQAATTGEVMNLVSIDCQRIQSSFSFSQQLLSIWFLIGIGLYELYQPVGVAFLGCIGMLIVILIIAFFLGKFRMNFFIEILKLKGKRSKVLGEIIKGIKIIKVYTWEPFFTDKVSFIRRQEIDAMKRFMRIVASELTLVNTTSYYMNFVVVLIFLLVSTEPYDAQRAFVTLTVMNVIKAPIAVLPFLSNTVIQSYVSLGRIGDFLTSQENNPLEYGSPEKGVAVAIERGFFKWDRSSQLSTLHNLDVSIEEGKLTAVVGMVGSGKSSLFSCILGEMEKVGGTVKLKGSVAYVTQSAWIQNMTIRDNILYGKEYNVKKYNKVIERCCLKPDLNNFPAGDLTEIGERGINLSGGQKQRINVARAVYSDADIYLFDDPLSAVDAHVGKDLFTKVIGNSGLLKKKTRILVTHSIHWLPYVDRIITMQDGTISEDGSYEQLLSRDGHFASFLREHLHGDDYSDDDDEHILQIKREMYEQLNKVTPDDSTGFTSSDADGVYDYRNIFKRRKSSKINSLSIEIAKKSKTFIDQQKENEGKLISEEEFQIGSVKLQVFLDLMKSMTKTLLILALLFLCITQGSLIYANFWITSWTTDEIILNSTLISTDTYLNRQTFYISVYAGLILLGTISLWVFDIFLLTGFVKASARVHHDMLACVMRCPMSFFDTTPSGRIMNRFSSDIDAIDERFRRWANLFTFQTAGFIGTLVVIVILTPFVILVIIPIFILYLIFTRYFLATVRQLKRNEGITRSPVFNHISETIAGRSVIRAYKSQSRFTKELYKRLDVNSTFLFAANAGTGWVGLRVQSVGNLIVLAAALFCVLTPGLSGADAGLSLSYAFQIISTMNIIVQTLSLLQMEVISIERAQEYTQLQSEAAWIEEQRPPKGWPKHGQIEFNNYSTRYRPGQDLVLRNIEGSIACGEKIGVIGRTGAGKSSLSFALFRLIERVGGRIVIDGVDIAKIGLHDLRYSMSILPQDPVIFSGTLRSNLDPKTEFSDNEIWHALDYAHLKEYIKRQDQQLDTQLGENGGNLSVGQKQLVCLARTLLHKRKILILDEATAAVDIETDNLIQETIKSQFTSSTLISIAHRINTVMDYDRIIVMDQGKIVQFDKPDVLLTDENGHFFSLAKQAGVV